MNNHSLIHYMWNVDVNKVMIVADTNLSRPLPELLFKA